MWLDTTGSTPNLRGVQLLSFASYDRLTHISMNLSFGYKLFEVSLMMISDLGFSIFLQDGIRPAEEHKDIWSDSPQK